LLLTANAVFAERGYAKIENGTLHTDNGDLIRGCLAHMMGFAKEKYKNLSWWQALRDRGHLNCVRMMAYNSPSWYGGSGPGVNTSELGDWLDIAVENAGMAGMYIIIDDHSFCCGGKMPINNDSFQHGIDFWNYVSQRYGKYSHVIFEIKNEPPDGAISSNLWTTHTKAIYKIIRQYAPNTPVITHTPGADNDKEPIDGISKCRSGSDTISYSPDGGNALVAWHGYGTGDINSSKSDLNGPYVWQTQKISAVICDEFGDSDPNHGYDMAKFLEDKKVSWVWLCVNEMEFGSGTAIKTGYDWVKYPPTWSKDPYAKDMTAGPSGMGGGNNCTVYVSESSHSFSSEAGNTIVTVTTTEGFTVSDNQEWIGLNQDGNKITITVTENTGSGSRSGIVSISGCENKNISVTQEGQGTIGGVGGCIDGKASFIQTAGKVVIEAENFNENNQQNDLVRWQISNGQSGFSGSGYVHVADGSVINNGVATDNSRLIYNIEFTSGGNYIIWVRRWAPDGAGNSVFATLGGLQSSGIDNTADEGTWIWKSLGTVSLSEAGVYKLEIIRREDGYLVDKVVINSGVTPEGEGTVETTCATNGINEFISENKICIYPNPVNGQVLNVILDSQQTTPVFIEIYNVTGQQVLESITSQLNPQLNVNGFHKGIYLLRVRTKDKIHQQKFTID
jgi:hypothetical protein